MEPDKILVNYFKENMAQFGLEKLREHALKQGRSNQEIDMALKSLSEQKKLDSTTNGITPNKNFNLSPPNHSKKIFIGILIILFLVGSVLAVFYLFNGTPGLEKSEDKGLIDSIELVQVSEEVLDRVIEKKGFPNSLYLRYQVILPKEIALPVNANLIEFYYQKQSESILKAKIFQKDEKGTLFSESLMEFSLNNSGQVEDIISSKACSMGVCVDGKTFSEEHLDMLNSEEISIGDEANFIGKLNLLGIDSFCFDLSNVPNKRSIACKHPEYNVIFYHYKDMEGYPKGSEFILRELKINPQIPEDIFFLDSSSGINLGDLSDMASEIERLVGNTQ